MRDTVVSPNARQRSLANRCIVGEFSLRDAVVVGTARTYWNGNRGHPRSGGDLRWYDGCVVSTNVQCQRENKKGTQ
jgi:hypothetical protein